MAHLAQQSPQHNPVPHPLLPSPRELLSAVGKSSSHPEYSSVQSLPSIAQPSPPFGNRENDSDSMHPAHQQSRGASPERPPDGGSTPSASLLTSPYPGPPGAPERDNARLKPDNVWHGEIQTDFKNAHTSSAQSPLLQHQYHYPSTYSNESRSRTTTNEDITSHGGTAGIQSGLSQMSMSNGTTTPTSMPYDPRQRPSMSGPVRSLATVEPNQTYPPNFDGSRRGSTDPSSFSGDRRYSQGENMLPLPSINTNLPDRRESVATDYSYISPVTGSRRGSVATDYSVYSSQPPSPNGGHRLGLTKPPTLLDNRPDLTGQRRESLPSIHIPPGGSDPYGRRHSIAAGEINKRSNQEQHANNAPHPGALRPDMRQPSGYGMTDDRYRSSYSAPSSPPLPTSNLYDPRSNNSRQHQLSHNPGYGSESQHYGHHYRPPFGPPQYPTDRRSSTLKVEGYHNEGQRRPSLRSVTPPKQNHHHPYHSETSSPYQPYDSNSMHPHHPPSHHHMGASHHHPQDEYEPAGPGPMEIDTHGGYKSPAGNPKYSRNESVSYHRPSIQSADSDYGYYQNSPGSAASNLALGSKQDTPYSRSPELRVSHKLAERKRRKEMKDLFDELRDALPVEKSMKTSKWEILSKAVEYIHTLKARDMDMEREISMLRKEVDMLKMSNSH
ncbi:hypothetical protein BZG36_03556 [Bifiguratus adelaidae]|uniref:BHLH domain-containing protein n=1 Tax=Bifiguratus adelaidae TaxID=1938954 RepID=A0A261Y0C8_9FUNG|nr:hypothetical protein BZG36_03556 [Bifiguratus adelaidae]